MTRATLIDCFKDLERLEDVINEFCLDDCERQSDAQAFEDEDEDLRFFVDLRDNHPLEEIRGHLQSAIEALQTYINEGIPT